MLIVKVLWIEITKYVLLKCVLINRTSQPKIVLFSNATYAEIKEYVLKEHGLNASNLYISQVKRKCGLEVGENYNLTKSEDSKQPNCPEEKEKAIVEALKYFGMI